MRRANASGLIDGCLRRTWAGSLAVTAPSEKREQYLWGVIHRAPAGALLASLVSFVGAPYAFTLAASATGLLAGVVWTFTRVSAVAPGTDDVVLGHADSRLLMAIVEQCEAKPLLQSHLARNSDITYANMGELVSELNARLQARSQSLGLE